MAKNEWLNLDHFHQHWTFRTTGPRYLLHLLEFTPQNLKVLRKHVGSNHKCAFSVKLSLLRLSLSWEWQSSWIPFSQKERNLSKRRFLKQDRALCGAGLWNRLLSCPWGDNHVYSDKISKLLRWDIQKRCSPGENILSDSIKTTFSWQVLKNVLSKDKKLA